MSEEEKLELICIAYRFENRMWREATSGLGRNAGDDGRQSDCQRYENEHHVVVHTWVKYQINLTKNKTLEVVLCTRSNFMMCLNYTRRPPSTIGFYRIGFDLSHLSLVGR